MLLGKQEEESWPPIEPGNTGHIVAHGFPACKLTLNKGPAITPQHPPFKNIAYIPPGRSLNTHSGGNGPIEEHSSNLKSQQAGVNCS